MTKTKLFKTISFLLLLETVLYFLEIKFYLTWTIWWYDILLHFLGGLIVGSVTLMFLQRFFNAEKWSVFRIVLMTILSSFIVGMLWEIYEVYFNLVSPSDGISYITDTVSDLLFDMVGGFLGAYCGITTWRKN